MGSGQMVRQLALDEKIAGSTPASPAIQPAQVDSGASAAAARASPAVAAGVPAVAADGPGAAAGVPAVAAGDAPVAAAAASAAFLAWAALSASALARSCWTNSM